FKSSPYVLPVDLGLFAKVLGTKQQQFDIGTQKIQAGIDALGQLDVMKEEDRTYLNSKINNLVNSLNQMGSVDFSDMNVLNQIEGMGGDIYGDNKVITALSSTKAARKLISGYEKYKTDPKLSKLYSPVNEAYDMKKVMDWVN